MQNNFLQFFTFLIIPFEHPSKIMWLLKPLLYYENLARFPIPTLKKRKINGLEKPEGIH
jgi:hypothetical protein